MNSLQQKVIQFEARVDQNSKDLLSDTLNAPNDRKITQQGNYTLNSNMGSVRKKSSQENDTNFHQAQEASFKSLSEDSRIHFKNHQTTQEYNITSKKEKAQNRGNFITSEDNLVDDVWRSPGRIPQQERIEIIQKGFQLNQEGPSAAKQTSLQNIFEEVLRK